MRRQTAVLSLLLALLAGPVAAQQTVTIPDLPEGYQTPSSPAPAPRGWQLDVLDVSVLAAALIIAAVLILKVRRRWPIFVLMLLSLAYFGFWRWGCVCPIGAIQNVSQAGADTNYAVPLVVAAFFILPILASLFWGRNFCAAVCPLGAVQDVVGVAPQRIPRWVEHALGMLAWLYLVVAVLMAATGAAYLICRYDPFVGIFRLAASWQMLVLIGCFLAIGIFIARPYCRFLCPLGAIFRVTSSCSANHAKVTPDECIECRLCEDSCPYNAILPATPSTADHSRQAGRKRLLGSLLALPLLVGLGGWVGYEASGLAARMHPTVRLARQVRSEQLIAEAKATAPIGQIDASKAFWNSQRTTEELYAAAVTIQDRYEWATALAGAIFGLIVGLKLISLCVHRRREKWQPDRAICLSCGRCFAACPIERQRRGEIPAEQVEKIAAESGRNQEAKA
ncbi:MAG: 4Fe-4S binding protein [Phycisphaerae bacterium]